MSVQKIMVLDGNSIINRAFFGLQGPKILCTSDGLYTNALFGFLNILFKFLEEEKPEFICVAFDLKAPTFRHKEYEGYKAQRKGMPDELAVQMPVLKELLDAMRIPRVEVEGYEADDIIGSISRISSEEHVNCVIITGDRDSLQLAAHGSRVKIPSTRGGKTEVTEYDYDRIVEKYGVTPDQMIDVKGLMGDPSDNIPGVPGIGEKTALELVSKFGSIEELYEHIDEVQARKNIKENLITYRDQAFLSKRLGTIELRVPGIDTVAEFKRQDFDREKLYNLLKRLEFRTFLNRLKLTGGDVEAAGAAAGATAGVTTGAVTGALAGATAAQQSIGEGINLNSEDAKDSENASSAGVSCPNITIQIINNLCEAEKLAFDLQKSGEFSFIPILEQYDKFSKKLAACSFALDDKIYFIKIGQGAEPVQESFVDSVSNIPTDSSQVTISEEAFLNTFKDIFESESIKKNSHNIKPFIVYLRRHGIELRGLDFDTMIGAYILNPSRDKYLLEDLAQEYLNVTIPALEEATGKGRNYISYFNLPVETLSNILGRQVQAIPALCKIFEGIIRENGQEKLLHEIELPLVEVLAEMEYWGFKADPEKLKQFKVELEKRISELETVIYISAGEEFNINSPKQLGVVLFEKLKLPVMKKTKTGYSTDAEVLETLAPMHEIVAGILEYRQLMKLKSTYVDGLLDVINPETGKIHSSFNQTVTVTGRISSTEPNLQNIPIKLEMGRQIRKVFIASSEDFELADADYSQIELRVLAHITRDPNMVEAFKNNIDIHTVTASQVFGVPKEDVTSLLRSRAKAVNFGIVYGIGDFSLSKDLGITKKEAKKYIEGYLENYKNVRQYMHDIVKEGKTAGFVSTMLGRRRYLPELQSSNKIIQAFGERIAMNTPIQGSAADIIKIAMVSVFRELKKRNLKSRLILQVHDELIVETLLSEKDQIKEIMEQCMENAVKMEVPLTAELKFGRSWYESK